MTLLAVCLPRDVLQKLFMVIVLSAICNCAWSERAKNSPHGDNVGSSGAPAICIGHKTSKEDANAITHVHNATFFFVGEGPRANGRVTVTCAASTELTLHKASGCFSPLTSLPYDLQSVQPVEVKRNGGIAQHTVLPMVSQYIADLPLDMTTELQGAVLVSESDKAVAYLLHQFHPESGRINFYYHHPLSAAAAHVSRRSLATCPNGYCYVLKKLPPGCKPKTKGYPACTKACVCK